MARWREAASSQTPPKDVAAQGPEGFHADRQAAETPRYAGQGQRQGRLRHRRDASRHEVRDPGGNVPVFGGKVGKVDDSAAKEDPGRAEGRRARRPGRGRRRSHVGGEEGPRCARRSTWNEGPNAQRQLEGHLAGSARGERKGRRWSQSPRATSPRALRPARSSRRLTSCRFSPTRRWSR